MGTYYYVREGTIGVDFKLCAFAVNHRQIEPMAFVERPLMAIAGTVGFAVVYRWRVIPGKEAEFVQAWEIVTVTLRGGGGLGSRLHRVADGTWLAYAQWPNRHAWETAKVTSPEASAALRRLQDAIEERLEPLLLEPVADYLVPNIDD